MNSTAASLEQSAPREDSRPFLEPTDRASELLFGLIMVLTFTGSLSIANEGQSGIRAMLIGALGCNFAWGIIDAVLYLMNCIAERGKGLATLRAVRAASDPEEARRLIADALPPVIASLLEPAEVDSLHQRLRRLPEPPTRVRLGRNDWLRGLGVFLWVFASMFPVAIPFLLMDDATRALRVSNAIALVMLFLVGVAYGRSANRSPWLAGIAMVVLGSALVGLTILLGG